MYYPTLVQFTLCASHQLLHSSHTCAAHLGSACGPAVHGGIVDAQVVVGRACVGRACKRRCGAVKHRGRKTGILFQLDFSNPLSIPKNLGDSRGGECMWEIQKRYGIPIEGVFIPKPPIQNPLPRGTSEAIQNQTQTRGASQARDGRVRGQHTNHTRGEESVKNQSGEWVTKWRKWHIRAVLGVQHVLVEQGPRGGRPHWAVAFTAAKPAAWHTVSLNSDVQLACR